MHSLKTKNIYFKSDFFLTFVAAKTTQFAWKRSSHVKRVEKWLEMQQNSIRMNRSGQTWRGRAAPPADPCDESVPNRAPDVGGKRTLRAGQVKPVEPTDSVGCACAPR